ncbi:MAG: manganese efflux pump MntP family protein [Firmicutes bacterium]|nr:manganese efflux pump MntP family protein [Bacillota bacterium]
MNFWELFLIAAGLSMDAFAVSVGLGLSSSGAAIRKALTAGAYFGVFQAVMPVVGYMAGALFAKQIVAYDHWIAFGLLCFLGWKMIAGGLKKKGCLDRECPAGGCRDRECPAGERPPDGEVSLRPARMLPLALATSIDALAVGVSFAFLRVSLAPAAAVIGLTTLLLSAAGVKIGNLCGTRLKSWAEIAGGAVLALIGVKILLEHLGIIGF